MKKEISPAVAVVAIIVLVGIVFGLYKVFLGGKKDPQAQIGTVVPAPGSYSQGMPGGGSGGGPSPAVPGPGR